MNHTERMLVAMLSFDLSVYGTSTIIIEHDPAPWHEMEPPHNDCPHHDVQKRQARNGFWQMVCRTCGMVVN